MIIPIDIISLILKKKCNIKEIVPVKIYPSKTLKKISGLFFLYILSDIKKPKE